MPSKLNISRRDFLNGAALSLAAGASLSPFEIMAMSGDKPLYYPPALTGLRGSHPGSFEIAHAMVFSGEKLQRPARHSESVYDLIVVGGGVSGLAAAHLWQDREGADQSILVLDNHDDFGGHAKRNEFTVDGETLLCYGGSQSLDGPSAYSAAAKSVLADIGIQPERFYDYFDQGYMKRHGLGSSIYFSAENYGKDITLPSVFGTNRGKGDTSSLDSVIDQYPISKQAKQSLRELLTNKTDYLKDIPLGERVAYCRAISYDDFLRKHAGVPEELILIIRDVSKGYWGFGFDALSTYEAYNMGAPGSEHLDFGESSEEEEEGEPYIFHFPDGNASIARALVRKLIPDAVPGSTQEDLVTASVDYERLDRASNTARIRLNSMAIDVRHSADESFVDVSYIRNGKVEMARARHVVMACYNSIIPHICPEFPAEQKAAVDKAVKTPLVYISIAVKNWHAMARMGCNRVYEPQAPLMYSFGLDFPVSIGDYKFTSGPDSPTVLHGTYLPTMAMEGASLREMLIAGRRQLLEKSFDDYEKLIVQQLESSLRPGGFDAQRDIAGITVNRWPHGYAYEYNDLVDPADYGTEKGPHILARKAFGRISIANSDASAYAYIDGAIDAADRAVREQIAF
jgi:spermidine dehydrogenase